MTNSRKRTLSLIAIVFGLLLCLGIFMPGTNMVKAEVRSSEELGLLSGGDNNGYLQGEEPLNVAANYEVSLKFGSGIKSITDAISNIEYTSDANLSVMENGTVFLGVELEDLYDPNTLTVAKNADVNVIQATLTSFLVQSVNQNLELTFSAQKISYTVSFNVNGGNPINDTVTLFFGESYSFFTASRTGYDFLGWFSEDGKQYTDKEGNGIGRWETASNITLYAHWKPIRYNIYFEPNGGSGGTISKIVEYDGTLGTITVPTYRGGRFLGYFTEDNRYSTQYYDANGRAVKSSYKEPNDIHLYAVWDEYTYNINLVKKHSQEPDVHWTLLNDYNINYSTIRTMEAPETMTYNGEVRGFSDWQIILGGYTDFDANTNPWQQYSTERILEYSAKDIIARIYPNLEAGAFVTIRARYNEVVSGGDGENTCVAAGTLITLADGTQKPVEQLTGNEMLLVWNMLTGTFDTAPILFVDSDPAKVYEVINLYFSDGTNVKVITEHAFWDINLNEYVYLRSDAAKYIGHWFNKLTADEYGNLAWTSVQLTDVVVQEEYTSAWSPVTCEHLCYYVNGMLSMPGGIDGLINIFDVNSQAMQFDMVAMQNDIATYGLFTYEEFAEIVPITEDIFNAFNGQYLKVSIGKGLISIERIQELVERYAIFF